MGEGPSLLGGRRCSPPPRPRTVELALALCHSILQTFTRVSAHTLPPGRPEDRGALWSPASRPRLMA